MKRALLLGACAPLVCALAWSTTARAQDASRDAVEQDMRGYYAGERNSAYVIGGTGALAAGAGAYLVTRDTEFARGLGWPLVVMGGLEALGAVFYAFQVSAETDHYASVLARDPTAYRAEEIDHIQGTSKRFVFYRLTELSFAVAGAGVGIYGLATNRDALKGAGLGVAGLAIPFFIIDSINDARASRYLRDVRGFQPSVGVQPTSVGTGWLLSLGAQF
jgi:hypothetical protein